MDQHEKQFFILSTQAEEVKTKLVVMSHDQVCDWLIQMTLSSTPCDSKSLCDAFDQEEMHFIVINNISIV